MRKKIATNLFFIVLLIFPQNRGHELDRRHGLTEGSPSSRPLRFLHRILLINNLRKRAAHVVSKPWYTTWVSLPRGAEWPTWFLNRNISRGCLCHVRSWPARRHRRRRSLRLLDRQCLLCRRKIIVYSSCIDLEDSYTFYKFTKWWTEHVFQISKSQYENTVLAYILVILDKVLYVFIASGCGGVAVSDKIKPQDFMLFARRAKGRKRKIVNCQIFNKRRKSWTLCNGFRWHKEA